MPKFRVSVTVIAKDSYVVPTLDSQSCRQAEELAITAWRNFVSADFQVANIDEAQAEAEQLTWECGGDCGKEITYEEWAKGDGWCLSCVAKEASHCAEI